MQDLARQDTRSNPIARWLIDTAQDLRHAFRGMRRDAGFTTFVILIAGIGIGASATIFSVVNALLLRPLPFHDPDRLVWIANEEWNIQVSQLLDLRSGTLHFLTWPRSPATASATWSSPALVSPSG